MRAIADNQQVALAMGINVQRYFGLAWAMTGIVSALGGIIWGNLLGVDVNLSLVGLKVFPVVILGGLDSIPGAVVGGLIVGVVENVAAVIGHSPRVTPSKARVSRPAPQPSSRMVSPGSRWNRCRAV